MLPIATNKLVINTPIITFKKPRKPDADEDYLKGNILCMDIYEFI